MSCAGSSGAELADEQPGCVPMHAWLGQFAAALPQPGAGPGCPGLQHARYLQHTGLCFIVPGGLLMHHGGCLFHARVVFRFVFCIFVLQGCQGLQSMRHLSHAQLYV